MKESRFELNNKLASEASPNFFQEYGVIVLENSLLSTLWFKLNDFDSKNLNGRPMRRSFGRSPRKICVLRFYKRQEN